MARRLLQTTGVLVVLVLLLCVTPAPWRIYRWFSTDAFALSGPPDYIVVLGGGGIPSESGLVRTYHGAALGRAFTGSRLLISLPAEEGRFEDTALGRMQSELVLRGIEPERILVEPRGLNTRGQALEIRSMLAKVDPPPRLLIVTSPDHLKRSLLCFRKVGFPEVAGHAAFPESVEVDLRYDSEELSADLQFWTPDVGSSLILRYTFWTNLHYLAMVAREATGLAYYKLQGWV